MLVESDWGGEDFGIATILGSWSEHYKSWKNLKFAPVLIIKYEDLLKDTKKEFNKILDFLNKLIKIEIDEKRISMVINSCNFKSLEQKVEKEGFFESVYSKKNNKKLKFFYLGKKNNWKSLLNSEVEKSIRDVFLKEMKELNYV